MGFRMMNDDRVPLNQNRGSLWPTDWRLSLSPIIIECGAQNRRSIWIVPIMSLLFLRPPVFALNRDFTMCSGFFVVVWLLLYETQACWHRQVLSSLSSHEAAHDDTWQYHSLIGGSCDWLLIVPERGMCPRAPFPFGWLNLHGLFLGTVSLWSLTRELSNNASSDAPRWRDMDAWIERS